MICVDTTLLVDLWRESQRQESPSRALIEAHAGEEFVVPAHAAGEFLEGGGAVSEARLAESLRFLRLFRVGNVDVEIALRYARLVSQLRSRNELGGRSKPDLWIAAWAVQNSARLATRNTKHFGGIPDLELLAY